MEQYESHESRRSACSSHGRGSFIEPFLPARFSDALKTGRSHDYPRRGQDRKEEAEQAHGSNPWGERWVLLGQLRPEEAAAGEVCVSRSAG